jgi:hypothetical protein
VLEEDVLHAPEAARGEGRDLGLSGGSWEKLMSVEMRRRTQ